jgi:hypothetical protein
LTEKQLIDYLTRLLFDVRGNKQKIDDKLVKKAVELGIDDFWGVAPWAFKEKHEPITTTADQETVDLPDDFEGIVNVVERETYGGMKLIKLPSSLYDRLIPYSGDLNTDTPNCYKVYYDASDEVWKLALYPTPSSAITLYLTYHTIAVGGEIPPKYTPGLIATICKYLSLPGSEQHTAATAASIAEIERLKQRETVDVEGVDHFLDSSDTPSIGTNWSEYIRLGLWV